MSEDRILAFEGIVNFRDYGGYAVSGGGRVKRGALWRSGQHVGASDGDLTALAGLGLVTVTDLRGDSERALNPCRRHESFAAEVFYCAGETAGLASHNDAAIDVVTEEDARTRMRNLCSEIIHRPNLVTVIKRHFAALGDRDGASLIHCFAGKDRTGISVALVHHVLGVHADDAMADYLLTNQAMQGRTFIGKTGKSQVNYRRLEPAASAALLGVRAEYLEAAFAAMRAEHGSLDGYLLEVLDVDDAMGGRIKDRLVES